MGSVRDYFDVVGGVRSGLQDDPPWWAPGAIAIFGVLVLGVLGLSLVFGVDGDGAQQSARVSAEAPAAAGPVVGSPAGSDAPVAGDAGGEATAAPPAAASETVALADRTGTFQQVPRAAVAAARGAGAERLGLAVDSVRHQLVTADPGAGQVVLTVASLDGRQVVTVTAVAAAGGAWQVP